MPIVYILTNESMPDTIKIGFTDNLSRRLRELDNTSTPLPFECYYCCEVENSKEVEKRLHIGLGDSRIKINPKREFFRISPERVKVLLEGYSIREVNLDILSWESYKSDGTVDEEGTGIFKNGVKVSDW